MRWNTRTDGKEVAQYDTKETAQFIRAALKQAFPTVKFSVRISKYSMGSSTYVSWTDGPTTPEVEAITNRFRSTVFDGMTDSTSYVTQIVDGQQVQYQGYISASRDLSDEFRALRDRRAALAGESNAHAYGYTMRPNGCRVTLKPEARS